MSEGNEYVDTTTEEEEITRVVCSYCGYPAVCSYCGKELEGNIIHDNEGYHYCNQECRNKHMKTGKTKHEEARILLNDQLKKGYEEHFKKQEMESMVGSASEEAPVEEEASPACAEEEEEEEPEKRKCPVDYQPDNCLFESLCDQCVYNGLSCKFVEEGLEGMEPCETYKQIDSRLEKEKRESEEEASPACAEEEGKQKVSE